MQKWIQVGKNIQKSTQGGKNIQKSTQMGKNTKKSIQVGEKPRKKWSTRWNANAFDLANYCFQIFIFKCFKIFQRISESLINYQHKLLIEEQ